MQCRQLSKEALAIHSFRTTFIQLSWPFPAHLVSAENAFLKKRVALKPNSELHTIQTKSTTPKLELTDLLGSSER